MQLACLSGYLCAVNQQADCALRPDTRQRLKKPALTPKLHQCGQRLYDTVSQIFCKRISRAVWTGNRRRFSACRQNQPVICDFLSIPPLLHHARDAAIFLRQHSRKSTIGPNRHAKPVAGTPQHIQHDRRLLRHRIHPAVAFFLRI